ncbi:SDR family NAD(P)-dependent oxidoreductase [Fructobacillus durionis]|uniref:Short-chain dehydrogenase n=1 Tax=Fructobacillus durionis TaxID=283737 RepID=A0A1I1GAW3_9LACO|nr:SDR family oxidoreductase [Fructobacillus durionis]SFC06988.1 hypothetical protein SAMN05660453_0996 [Fructobacillus durionis]
MIQYKGKLALVTGASSGIGKEFAYRLAEKGSNVILVARSTDRLITLADELEKQYGITAYPFPADLSDPASINDLYEKIQKENLSVDILVNNAGFGLYGSFKENSADEYQKMVDLNINSLIRLTSLFLPEMQEKKSGIIINLASLLGFAPFPYMSVYSATKAFVLSFTESLWAENQKTGVQILALAPGATKTDFYDVAGSSAMPGGINRTAADVVTTAFKALDKKKMTVVDGGNNKFIAKLPRLLSQKTVVSLFEKVVRAANEKKQK